MDVPAVKAVLHAQALERCVFLRRVEFDVPLPAPRARKHRRNVLGDTWVRSSKVDIIGLGLPAHVRLVRLTLFGCAAAL